MRSDGRGCLLRHKGCLTQISCTSFPVNRSDCRHQVVQGTFEDLLCSTVSVKERDGEGVLGTSEYVSNHSEKDISVSVYAKQDSVSCLYGSFGLKGEEKMDRMTPVGAVGLGKVVVAVVISSC